MAKPVDLLREICTVPGTDVALEFSDDASCTAADGTRFRAQRGVPILRDEPQPLVERPTDYNSGGVPDHEIARMDALRGYTLFLGAGNSTFRHPRVVEVEYDLFRETDVIADAHRLPFRSNSFELYFAMNVFEHLQRPYEAAREALRVLVPGGAVHIHTAFLQPLHEEPAHYFNATEFGIREWFRGFDAVEVGVSTNFNPLYALSWLASELLHGAERHFGERTGAQFGALTLAEAARFWPGDPDWNPTLRDLFFRLPEGVQRRIAAGFELRACKPREA